MSIPGSQLVASGQAHLQPTHVEGALASLSSLLRRVTIAAA
jgi:hypothetical protein